jgi:cob(I)alamin adenosyltransferase
MVNLTRIYTRTGDDGTTSLGDASRTGKNDPRLKAYADVDEANCTIGLALASTEFPEEVRTVLLAIQNDLFDVGADLCTPVVEGAAHLHIARTVVRRAERSTWAALDTYHGGMNSLTATYLNRLSDLLFILGRLANKDAGGDVLWQPGANR